MAWLAGWLYRKELVLGSSVGATNYQFKILVGESNGVIGSDVNCEACLPSFDDLRFTTDDEGTLLDYWIEGVSGATPLQTAIVWVKVPVISTTTTIFMYSGNASAPAVSNGTNTFMFFDDASVNRTSDYQVVPFGDLFGNGDISWSNGVYSITTTAQGNIFAKIISLGAKKNIALHATIYKETATYNQQGGIAFMVENPAVSYGLLRYVDSLGLLQFYHQQGPGYLGVTYSMPRRVWTKAKVGVYNTTVKASWGNILTDNQITIYSTIPAGGWGVYCADASGTINYFKDVFVRNFVLPEPELLYIDPVSAVFTADITSGFAPLIVGFTDQSYRVELGFRRRIHVNRSEPYTLICISRIVYCYTQSV